MKSGKCQHAFMSCHLYLQLPFPSTDEICTNIAVPACTSSATECQKIGENNEAVTEFEKQNEDVYAEECKEPDGTVCVYTDVVYSTCPTTAKASKFKF